MKLQEKKKMKIYQFLIYITGSYFFRFGNVKNGSFRIIETIIISFG